MELLRDPIIEIYLNLLKNSKEAKEMPVFSETLLRFAFRNIFGKYRCINSSELLMYRKLLLYYYAEEYPDVKVLAQIMACFDEDELNLFIDESESVMKEWKDFVEHELMPDALTQTFKMIISEWSKRYKVKNGEINFDLLQTKATELQTLLNYNESFIDKFIKKRRNKLIFPTLDAQAMKSKWTEYDLTYTKIIKDLLYKISPLVRKKVQDIALNTSQNNQILEMKDNEEVTEEEEEEEENEIPAKRQKVNLIKPKTVQKEDEEEEEEEEEKRIPSPVQQHFHDSSSNEIFEIMEICSSDEEQEVPITTTTKRTTTTTTTTPIITDRAEEKEVQIVTKIITLSTAMSYITEVHAFALVNGYNDVSELMQRVTELLKTKETD